MKKHSQIVFLSLSILLILTAFAVNADTAKTTTSKAHYGYYYHRDSSDYLKKFQGFLPDPAPEERYYHTWMTAYANVDDTPEKEDVVLIGVDTKPHTPFGKWHQAFLLITHTKGAQIEKKELFKLYDTGAHPLNVPAAKTIELHNPPFSFSQPTDVAFKLADVTGDGILDVWVESAYGVALISFQNGEFKEVYSRYTVSREKLVETPDVEYHSSEFSLEFQGRMYHRFLPSPPTEKISLRNPKESHCKC